VRGKFNRAGTIGGGIRSVLSCRRAGLADWGHFGGHAPKTTSRVVGSGLFCRHKLTTLDCEAETILHCSNEARNGDLRGQGQPGTPCPLTPREMNRCTNTARVVRSLLGEMSGGEWRRRKVAGGRKRIGVCSKAVDQTVCRVRRWGGKTRLSLLCLLLYFLVFVLLTSVRCTSRFHV
jgi:hypothetical protein